MTSPADYLRAVVAGLLPPEEDFTITESEPHPRTFILTIRAKSDRGAGMLLGKMGKTIEAIRRLMAVNAGVNKWSVTVNLYSEEHNFNVPQEARTEVR